MLENLTAEQQRERYIALSGWGTVGPAEFFGYTEEQFAAVVARARAALAAGTTRASQRLMLGLLDGRIYKEGDRCPD